MLQIDLESFLQVQKRRECKSRRVIYVCFIFMKIGMLQITWPMNSHFLINIYLTWWSKPISWQFPRLNYNRNFTLFNNRNFYSSVEEFHQSVDKLNQFLHSRSVQLGAFIPSIQTSRFGQR